MTLRRAYRSDWREWWWFGMALVVAFCVLVVPPLWLSGMVFALFLGVMSVKSPLASLIILLILAPLRTLIATESAWSLPFDVGQLLFLAFVSSYIVHRIIKGDGIFTGIAWHWVLGGILIFIFATGTGVGVAWSVGAWLSEWLKWWVIFLMALLSAFLGRGHGWQWLLFGVTVSAMANALVGIYIFLGGSGADHLAIGGRFFRAFGTFGQPNPFGGFMGMVLPIAVSGLLGATWVIWRSWQSRKGLHMEALAMTMFYGIACGLIGLALVFSWSRGAWLSILIAMGAMLFALPRHWWQRMVLLFGGVVFIGGAWLSGVLPASVTERLLSSTTDLFAINDVRGVDITGANYAVIERLAHWQAALNMAEGHFWQGVGFGNYTVAYDRYRLINWEEPLGHAHNYYLNIMAEGGMIGALAYVVMWLLILWFTWSITKHPDFTVSVAGAGLFGSWFYILGHSLLDNLYVNNLFLHMGVLLGVVITLHRQLFRFDTWGYYVTDS